MSTDRETITSTEEVESKERKREYHRQWYLRNREKKLAQNQEWIQNNLQRYRDSQKKWYQNNRDRHLSNCRSRAKRDIEARREVNKKWRTKNLLRFRELLKLYAREYRKIPQNKIAGAARRRIKDSVRSVGALKSSNSVELVGCSWVALRSHLENQFTDGMSWDNYGTAWHIDHIIPCAKFDLTKPEEQKACFHYSNLRPLCAKKNKQESSRRGIPQQATMFHMLDNPKLKLPCHEK